MQLNIDLCDLPEAKAHAILTALASCFEAEVTTKTGSSKPPKDVKKESTGNKLMRQTAERNAETKPPPAGPPLTDSPPLTIVNSDQQADLLAGPPAIQSAEDLGNDQAAATTTTQEVTTNTQAPSAETDAHGMPWDERIHAGTKGKMASGKRNGCWKYKPRVAPDTITNVEAELMSDRPPAQQAAGTNEAKPDTAVPKNTQDVGEVVQHIFDSKEDLPILLKMVTGDVTAGKVPRSASSNISGDLGFTNIMVVGEHPDRYQEFADRWVALRQMIVLQPDVAQQCLTDWPGVSAMLELAY